MIVNIYPASHARAKKEPILRQPCKILKLTHLKYIFIKEPKIEFNFTVESVSEFYMVVSESVLFLRARGMLDKY
jgi:hypothetical protein